MKKALLRCKKYTEEKPQITLWVLKLCYCQGSMCIDLDHFSLLTKIDVHLNRILYQYILEFIATIDKLYDYYWIRFNMDVTSFFDNVFAFSLLDFDMLLLLYNFEVLFHCSLFLLYFL